MRRLIKKIKQDDLNESRNAKTDEIGDPRTAVNEKGLTKKQWMVLDEFRASGSVRAVCKRLGVSKNSFYRWLSTNVLFRQHYEAMRDAVADVLEAVMLDRAINGTRRAVYHQGKRIGWEREWDTKLQTYILQRFRPEYANDGNHRLMGPSEPSEPVSGVVVNVSGDAVVAIDDRRARLLALIDAERERRRVDHLPGGNPIPANGNGHGPINGSTNGNGKH